MSYMVKNYLSDRLESETLYTRCKVRDLSQPFMSFNLSLPAGLKAGYMDLFFSVLPTPQGRLRGS